MAKKPPAIYEPGELDRVRRNLGDIDHQEAKRIAGLLGGEVGVEKGKQAAPARRRPGSRDEVVDVSVGGPAPRGAPRRRIEVALEEEAHAARGPKRKPLDPADDPSAPVHASYRERVRMDRYAAQPEFEIKNSSQVLVSMLALFGEPTDLVNPAFTTRRMNEYYSRLEQAVTATRTLLPRNNASRSERFKKDRPFDFEVIDVIRKWNIEKIASDLGRLQSRPRDVVVGDYADILKAFYGPLFKLGKLDVELHVREAYRALYKALLMENPVDAKAKHQGQVKAALASFAIVQRSLRYLLYPLLLKTLSDRWLPYESFFEERRRRVAAFLGIGEAERLEAPAEVPAAGESGDASEPPSPERDPGAVPEIARTDASDGAADSAAPTGEKSASASEEASTKTAEPRRSRALERGLSTLDTLFPEADWPRADAFPDLHPYFASVFDLKKGCELIAPDDPMQQIVVLVHILEELFYGLRYVEFGTVSGPDGELERVDVAIGSIVGHWHDFIEVTLGKEYLPRLSEYCRALDASSESRTSGYTKRIQAELLWLKRLYFLPFLRFDSMLTTPPFTRQEIRPLYAEVQELKRLLTAVAAGIEAGTKAGGPEKNAHCPGIDNPWTPYVFQVPNPLSTRLDALLGGKGSKRKNNASLVFFTLSAATVLDALVNDETSWAYGDGVGYPFRSLDGLGSKPIFGVDLKIDADAAFRRALRAKASPGATK